MSYTPVPDVTAGDFGRASWADIVKDDLADHETRIVAVEATGTGDVVGPSASVDKEIALFDATTGKLLERATGTGYVKVTSGVMGTPSATVPLATDVSGDLPFANLTQGSALSVLGVTGNATADHASIVAASDGQVLRRSGTSVGFGAVDLASANAITGALPLANLPTNFAQIFKAIVTLTDAQIKALPTTPITIVAAQGSGKMIRVLYNLYERNFPSAAYTNIDSSYASMQLETNGQWSGNAIVNDSTAIGGDGSTSVPLVQLTNWLGGVGSDEYLEQPVPLSNAAGTPIHHSWVTGQRTESGGAFNSRAGSNNQPLVLAVDNNGSGNFTGGNGSNTMTVTVVYLVL